jgi:hypothetical protein
VGQPRSFPRALLRGVVSVADGGLPLLHRRAAGAAARSIGEAVLLRRAWGVCREYAREIARAARVTGEGWVLADAFDTWRGESRRRTRDSGEGAGLIDASMLVRGVRLPAHGGGATQATTCVRDQDWTRHARHAVRRAGYSKAAAAHEARVRAEAGALKRKRAHEEITGMRVGLHHWGRAGPLPRGSTGAAAHGGPDSDTEGDSDGARRLNVILPRDPPAKRHREGEAAARSRAEIERAVLVDTLREMRPVPVHMRARRGRFLVALALDAVGRTGEGRGSAAPLQQHE